MPEANTIAVGPATIGQRTDFGHWEGDLVAFGKANLTSLVERKSRYLLLARNPSRHSAGVMSGIASHLGRLPAHARCSITFDRGTEFAFFSTLKRDLGIDSWFCKPQAPWRKGSVENTNGRLRDECLNEHVFSSLAEARRIIENWRIDYNTLGPHTSLGGLAPSMFASRSDQDQITAGPNL